MKNKRIFKNFSALCAALALMMGLSVTAFAQGTEQPPAEDATNDENVVVEKTEDSPALTPEGNAALVDDFGGNKQLITVTTKAGNYFYILIDRANEDKETAVHFLNQVDEADLMALMEDGQRRPSQPAPAAGQPGLVLRILFSQAPQVPQAFPAPLPCRCKRSCCPCRQGSSHLPFRLRIYRCNCKRRAGLLRCFRPP